MTISQRMFKLMDDKRLTQRELSKKLDNVFNNELVWKTYLKLTEKEKLEVQVFILGKGEAHEE